MKLKLAFLLMLGIACASYSFAQKRNIPSNPLPPPSRTNPNPTPQPTTPTDFYGMGYKTGYNLIVQGRQDIWQNSLTAAAQSGNMDYYNGLREGGIAAQSSQKPIKPQITDYVVFAVTSVYFYYTDGSWTSQTYASH